MDHQQLSFAGLTTTLKATGEPSRLRILALLAEAELTVSDLTEILRQSQPRLSRHLRLLAEAGLVDRFREGSWAFFRLGERGGAADLARILIGRLKADDPTVARDRERLTAVRADRAAAAPCRRMGPHPPAACRRRRGRRSDPRRARRQTDPIAA
jgi:DNA-binding transcriptional ArsR family regulator